MLKSLSMPSVSGSPLEKVVEGARRATGENSSGAARPDLEVAPVARRRRFSYAQKVAFLAEVARCPSGRLGASCAKMVFTLDLAQAVRSGETAAPGRDLCHLVG